MLLVVKEDCSWICQVNGLLEPQSCFIYSSIPTVLSLHDFSSLLNILFGCFICPGNSDSRFVEFCQNRKGKFFSVKKTVVPFLDIFDSSHPTVRHISCELLVGKKNKCAVCVHYA